MYNGVGISSARGTATSGYVQKSRGHVNHQRQRRTTERNAGDGPPRSHSIVSAAAREQGNLELQLHERKRQLENELLILRDEMEEEGLVEEEIDATVQQRRQEAYDKWKRDEETKRARQEQLHNEEVGPGPVADDAGGPAAPVDTIALHRGPNNHDHDRSRRTCYNCGEPGHLARQCPHPPQDRSRQRTSQARVLDPMYKQEENKRLATALGIAQNGYREGAAFDRELQEEKRQERLREREKLQKKEDKERRRQRKLEKLEAKKSKPDQKRRRRSHSVSKERERRRRSRSESSSSSGSSRSSSSSSTSSSSSSSASRNASRKARQRGERKRRRYSSGSSSSNSSSSSSSRSSSTSGDSRPSRQSKEERDAAVAVELRSRRRRRRSRSESSSSSGSSASRSNYSSSSRSSVSRGRKERSGS